MAEFRNISGSTVNLPLLDRDIEPDEVFTVDDDVLAGVTLPANYFAPVEE